MPLLPVRTFEPVTSLDDNEGNLVLSLHYWRLTRLELASLKMENLDEDGWVPHVH
jgi:hypothetical protein